MSDLAPVSDIEVTTAEEMLALGVRLAALLQPGDLILLTGDLGAGKTTLTQGIGAGLGVRAPITSPSFVLVREHPTAIAGLALLHVDAYRLHSSAELDDLDLDTVAPTAVTVVEWGSGLAESLAADRLQVTIRRRGGVVQSAEVDPRLVRLEPVGPRWEGVDLRSTLAEC